MVILREITKSNDTIQADYYPEGDSSKGHLTVDISTGEILVHESAIGYENSTVSYHVKKALIRLASLNEIPKQKTVMWY